LAASPERKLRAMPDDPLPVYDTRTASGGTLDGVELPSTAAPSVNRDRALLVQKFLPPDLLRDGENLFRICNACRYCEGFCAVYPAMERRRSFAEADLNYLANLCHNCGECFYACPFSPPHEFSLNPPRTLAEIRLASYQKYAWPGVLASLFRHQGLAAGISIVAAPLLFLVAMLAGRGPAELASAYSVQRGSFYALLPHSVMTPIFILVSLGIVVSLIIGIVRMWREMAGMDSGTRKNTAPVPFTMGVLAQAINDTFRLRYLEGGGEGCSGEDETPSYSRRTFHHLTFYGFMFCFASTTVAAIYHYVLNWQAPYPFFSAPVLLGTIGGAGLLIGPIGLLWLKRKRNPVTSDPAQIGLDATFLALLFLTGFTGLLLLALRETSAMGITLAIHLGLVLGLFVTMPYGKFVHGIYRFVALLRNEMEKQAH
jgi:citrate/tricarballylate utilization protein